MTNMKFLGPFACAALLTVAACKKERIPGCDLHEVPGDGTSLVGTWELYTEGGGFSGQTMLHLACNGNRLAFAADHTYKRFAEWKLVKSGSYGILRDSMHIQGNKPGDRIIFDGDSLSRQFISIKDKQLKIDIDIIDAGGSTYIRRNPDREK